MAKLHETLFEFEFTGKETGKYYGSAFGNATAADEDIDIALGVNKSYNLIMEFNSKRHITEALLVKYVELPSFLKLVDTADKDNDQP